MSSFKNQKIVLITSGQPALNPRIVKEADALLDAGYDVTVLYTYWNNWGTALDEKLLPQKKWTAIRTGGDTKEKKITYLLSRVIHKLSLLTPSASPAFAIARGSYFLMREAKKHKADLYIAHNLGALPAAVKAAKKHKSKSGFDAEDFHRFETCDDKTDAGVILKTRIENEYIPQTHYFTASSPKIAEAYKQLYTGLTPVILHNVFPNSNLAERWKVSNKPLKLFWFSQTIGNGRGLNDIIGALKEFDTSNFELHLLGDIPAGNQNFVQKMNDTGINITYYAPIAPDHLIRFASQFDIGLALEPSFCTNNNIALSNKIFTYMQAGLAVIASDTAAQKELLETYPQIGEVYTKGDVKSLSAVLSYYHAHRDKLKAACNASLKLAHEQFNWEYESEKLINLVKTILAT